MSESEGRGQGGRPHVTGRATSRPAAFRAARAKWAENSSDMSAPARGMREDKREKVKISKKKPQIKVVKRKRKIYTMFLGMFDRGASAKELGEALRKWGRVERVRILARPGLDFGDKGQEFLP